MVKQEVAEAAAAEAFAEPKAPPPKSSKKVLFFVILPLLFLLLGGGGGAYWFLFMRAPPTEDAHQEPEPPPKTYVYYKLPEILVNLSAANRRTSFLKISLSLQLDSEADVARVQQVMPRIVDGMHSYLRELRTDDVVGSAKLGRVRSELLDRVNAVTTPLKVVDVLFLDILLQ